MLVLVQNATQCLAALISAGKEELLAWGGDTAFAMRSLLDVASRLGCHSSFFMSPIEPLNFKLSGCHASFCNMGLVEFIDHLPSSIFRSMNLFDLPLLTWLYRCHIKIHTNIS